MPTQSRELAASGSPALAGAEGGEGLRLLSAEPQVDRGYGPHIAYGSRLGALRSAITRRREADEGKAFARRWRAERGPIASTEPYPFRSHRTGAEWM
jgi:hypothetical protein